MARRFCVTEAKRCPSRLATSDIRGIIPSARAIWSRCSCIRCSSVLARRASARSRAFTNAARSFSSCLRASAIIRRSSSDMVASMSLRSALRASISAISCALRSGVIVVGCKAPFSSMRAARASCPIDTGLAFAAATALETERFSCSSSRLSSANCLFLAACSSSRLAARRLIRSTEDITRPADARCPARASIIAWILGQDSRFCAAHTKPFTAVALPCPWLNSVSAGSTSTPLSRAAL